MKEFIDEERNIKIKASDISLGKNHSFGKNIDIQVKGKFHLGDRSRLGNNVEIRGNNVIFGNDLYHSNGLRVGGGGRFHPTANLTIGDRCTFHNNFINVSEPVEIGNDVGFSQDVAVITHGYWLSVLDGYPAKFAGVKIHNGVIVGYRSIILMGVEIEEGAVIAANSVVTKLVKAKSIYGGNPAKLIKEIQPIETEHKKQLVQDIITKYWDIAEYHNLNPIIKTEYPLIHVNDATFNAETLETIGKEDIATDDFRDYVRKWGLRFYTDRPFRSNFSF